MNKELEYIEKILQMRFGVENKAMNFSADCLMMGTFSLKITYGKPETCACIIYLATGDNFVDTFDSLSMKVLMDDHLTSEMG